MQALKVTDMSDLTRYGVKGPDASHWLARHHIAVPASANTWLMLESTMVMRLGASEFLIEDQKGGAMCAKLLADFLRYSGVYKIPRADASYLLAGSGVQNLLSEACAINLTDPALQNKALVMTQFADISATILRQNLDGEAAYRLWCDGSYSAYMKSVFLEFGAEYVGF